MAYLWRGIRARIQHMRCASYRGECSLCAEWKRAKRKAAIGCPDDCPACAGAGVRPTAPEATSGDEPPYGNRGERAKVDSHVIPALLPDPSAVTPAHQGMTRR